MATAKAAVPVIQQDNRPRLLQAVGNVLEGAVIATRIFRSQCEKVEKITDIFSDGLVHSSEWFDATMRSNLKKALEQAEL